MNNQQQYRSSSLTNGPQHIMNNASQRRPLVLSASPPATMTSKTTPMQNRVVAPQQQPTTPAVSLHNLRDWMHLSSTPKPPKSNSDEPSHAVRTSSAFSPPLGSLVTSSALSESPPPASQLAKQAPAAGFLLKLGTNVPTYKRRFFVLQPGTFLYYFLSEHDTIPRGCLDLEGSWLQEDVQENNTSSESPFRFSVHWPDNHHEPVILQARNAEQGRAWMEAIETRRLDYVQDQFQKQQNKNSALKSRVSELERQVKDYKLIETDRDHAIEDAAMWKQKMEQLDETLRRLSQRLRKPVKRSVVQDSASVQDDEKKTEHAGNEAREEEVGDTSLLDEAIENEALIDVMNVPGTHFSSLYNTCEQLRENLELASHEAATAVEDLTRANERVEATEKRMVKAEKHLCKLWEENCSLRKVVKQKKREKRVLVKEVLSLRTVATSASSSVPREDWSEHDTSSRDFEEASSALFMSEEEKLINELEDHVLSSIRLHEQMLMSGGALKNTSGLQNISAEQVKAKSFHSEPTIRMQSARISSANDDSLSLPPGETSDSLPVPSLFDDDDSNSESDDDELEHPVFHSRTPSVSSMAMEQSDADEGRGRISIRPLDEVNISSSSQASTPERPNPLTQLGPDSPERGSGLLQVEPRAPITREHATSRLVCPLADVVGTRNRSKPESTVVSTGVEELQVYHLTFYSRKIGLQFQKIPPPPLKSNGLLTDAIKADMAETVSVGSNRTTEELRRIAAISNVSKSAKIQEGDTCPLAQPVDAVIVCGFVGFDDSGSNVRPKLGARLVAFDGVSVEVGKWTFESIRKAIQARDRPLTLSFRNDYLTTEQRTILTRAIREVEAKAGPRKKNVPMHTAPPVHRRRPSIDPSVHSCITYDSDPLPLNQNGYHNDDDWSVSVEGSDYHYSRSYNTPSNLPHSFSGARSYASSAGPRSFSEAGSSASVLSAVAPLVSNLLSRSQKNKEPFSPDFLRRAPESVENTPQHVDFCSELL